MTNAILATQSLPETLFRLIQTEKVYVQEADNGVISITPIHAGSGLRGIAKNSNLTTEKLMAYRREDEGLNR